jgi:hypothetical protein
MTLQDNFFEDRTIYVIPEANFARFEKEMGKLSRRSERLIGKKITPVVFDSKMVLDADDKPLYRAIRVYLTAEMPVVDGWTFVARLDHSNETGNVIRRVPNLACDIPDFYRDCAPNCDHCKVRRMRRDTFLLRNNDSGVFQQVGSTCLTDFFGHDPYKIAKLAEMLGYATEAAQAAETIGEASLRDNRWVHMETYLTHVAATVRQRGWVSGKAAYENRSLTATRETAFQAMQSEAEVTAEDSRLVEEALDWARNLADKPVKSDYEHNVGVVAEALYIEPRSLGIAASIVGVYFNNRRRAMGVQKVNVGDMNGVIALMQRGGSLLKNPKINLMIPSSNQMVELKIAGAKSSVPGSVNVTDGRPFGENIWFGRISPKGEWSPSRSVSPETMTALQALLTALAANPAEVATAYGRLTGRCFACNLPLSNARSTEVGYGEVCASRYGLPWGNKRVAEAA